MIHVESFSYPLPLPWYWTFFSLPGSLFLPTPILCSTASFWRGVKSNLQWATSTKPLVPSTPPPPATHRSSGVCVIKWKTPARFLQWLNLRLPKCTLLHPHLPTDPSPHSSVGRTLHNPPLPLSLPLSSSFRGLRCRWCRGWGPRWTPGVRWRRTSDGTSPWAGGWGWCGRCCGHAWGTRWQCSESEGAAAVAASRPLPDSAARCSQVMLPPPSHCSWSAQAQGRNTAARGNAALMHTSPRSETWLPAGVWGWPRCSLHRPLAACASSTLGPESWEEGREATSPLCSLSCKSHGVVPQASCSSLTETREDRVRGSRKADWGLEVVLNPDCRVAPLGFCLWDYHPWLANVSAPPFLGELETKCVRRIYSCNAKSSELPKEASPNVWQILSENVWISHVTRKAPQNRRFSLLAKDSGDFQIQKM